jgi:Protein of unknown function (DUF4240)
VRRVVKRSRLAHPDDAPVIRMGGAFLVLLALALLTGCAGDGGAPTEPAATPAAATTAPEPTVPAAAPTAAAPAPTAPAPTSAARLGEPEFWSLVEAARQEAGDDTGRQSELLATRLEQLPAEEIADFGEIYRRLDEQAYTWDLWAAAYVIEDGCSDDCFRDFRAYLISLGRARYEAALKDPDSLAPVAEDAETGDWENADDPAPEAYEDAAGEDLPAGDSEPSGDPRGEPWDDEQQDELVQRYPALAERFR